MPPYVTVILKRSVNLWDKKIPLMGFCSVWHHKGRRTMRTLPGDLSRGHGEPSQANAGPAKAQRWPGKSGSFPSALQRQRDVRGRWPFPANQGEICPEERTPPSTFAQAGMEFPDLCWLVEEREYLYPLWLKTRIQKLIFWLCTLARNSKDSSVKFVYCLVVFVMDHTVLLHCLSCILTVIHPCEYVFFRVKLAKKKKLMCFCCLWISLWRGSWSSHSPPCLYRSPKWKN